MYEVICALGIAFPASINSCFLNAVYFRFGAKKDHFRF